MNRFSLIQKLIALVIAFSLVGCDTQVLACEVPISVNSYSPEENVYYNPILPDEI